ncbi:MULTISPECIES: GtrA family protein [unclassified Vibrio]|uniref:GtrA family protein n=1 Tax=Vibrio sp. HB236076 TaxID=3232307 RepID=A0AB39HH66_9VIBR|nr:GtrA family protein [Vibrio sp. HB161653]MDP5254466.1 GtrA family protein [Vibrio sp. HB161653]
MNQVCQSWALRWSKLQGEQKMHGLYWGVTVLVAVLSGYNLHISLIENVAHDALSYMPSYTEKFISEGRWINFALFEGLKRMPPDLAALLSNAFLFVFSFVVAHRFRPVLWSSVLFALVALNIPYFTMLFKWPMTLVPGTLMMALFALLSNKMSRTVLLLTAGVLFFATYPAFYFLMPLLFVGPLQRASWPELLRFVAVWIAGYVLGYGVSQASVYLYTTLATDHGHWIEFAQWRKSTPMHDVASLWQNVLKSSGNFERNARYIADLSGWFYLPVLAVMLWALGQEFKYCVLVFMVIFSIYASVLVLGVNVPLRSGITLPLGLMMFALLVKTDWARGALLLCLCVPFAYKMHDYNFGYNHKRIYMAQLFNANDARHYLKQPQQFKRIVVTLDERKMSDYFYDLTRSRTFINRHNLREHYIKPFLYKNGWGFDQIQVKNIKRPETPVGKAKVQKQGNTLLMTLE